MNISLTLSCIHDAKNSTFSHEKNITSCKLVLGDDYKKYHVIHLKTPIYSNSIQPFESVFCHYTKDNYIDEIWENISTFPTGSLYSLDKITDLAIVTKLCEQMVESLCEITIQGSYYDCLKTINNSVSFLQNIANFGLDEQLNPLYIQTHRMCIKNINSNMSMSIGKKKLCNQVELIPYIVKAMLLQKRPRKKNNTETILKIVPCDGSVCKLADLQPRFIKFNEELICRLHQLFCHNYKKLDLFINLPILFDKLEHTIHTTHSTVINM
ncbi:hypothetical protein MrNuV_ORF113 [Macrobrachium rosenbergii nudivirus]|nr:hypothetical protein MrNuV_ORF113 [Macrobrachium rosenbergii nudivirus]